MNSVVGSRICSLRNKKGITQTELGHILDVGKSTISNYERGYSRPDNESLVKMAEFFGVSTDYILGKSDYMKPVEVDFMDTLFFKSKGSRTKDGKKIATINVYSKIPAGIPVEAIDDIIDTEEILISPSENELDYIAIRVVGESMAPDILENDVVIIKKNPSPDTGDIVAVLIEGSDVTLKEFRRIDEGIMLVPKNDDYEAIFYSNRSLGNNPISIIGKVVEIRRKL